MILGLPPILGFLPLVLYIILMMKGKDMNLSVLICVILGAVMTGESVSGFGTVLQNSLSSFLSLIGFIIVLGSGLGEVLTRTKVAHNIVHLVIGKAKLKSKKQAIFIAMCTSTLLVSMLGTLSGSNAIIAPILIPIMASLGVTPSTLGVILPWRGGGRASDWSVCASCSNRHGTDRAELQPVYENGRTAVRSYHMGMYIFCCLPDTEAYGRKGVLQRGRSSFRKISR